MPPSTLNALVNDYNGGFLLNYLDPRERTRSLNPLPWALRATAPTDHNLSQKEIDAGTNSSKTFSLPKYLNEKHQIAVDAAGLEIHQQYYNFGSVRIQRNKMTLLIALVIGLGFCIGATVLNMKSFNDIPVVPAEVGVTKSNKTPAGIDAKQKRSLLDFMNEANKSVPKERFPKKTDLFNFNNLNVADSTKDKENASLSSDATPPPKKPVEDANAQRKSGSAKKKIDDSTKDKSKSSFSSEPTPPAKKIVEDASAQNLKSGGVKKPIVGENATLKKEETSSGEDVKAKQKPNILRALKNIIRSAMCAIRNKCD